MSNDMKKTQRKTLLQVWDYIKRYRMLVCLSILFAGVVVALTLYLPILVGKGNISSDEAQKIAKEEYGKYKTIQDKNYLSDFDKLIIEIKRIEGLN